MNECNIKRLISTIEGEKDKEKKLFALNVIESVAKCFDDIFVSIPEENSVTHSICEKQSVEALIIQIAKQIKK